jgi:hypothetical protein
MLIQFESVNIKGTDHFGDKDESGRIILNYISTTDVTRWTGYM